MPRYFFDLEVNGAVQRDDAGRELDGREHARKLMNEMWMRLMNERDREQDFECRVTVLDAERQFVCCSSAAIAAFTDEDRRLIKERAARRAAAKAARLAERRKTTAGPERTKRCRTG